MTNEEIKRHQELRGNIEKEHRENLREIAFEYNIKLCTSFIDYYGKLKELKGFNTKIDEKDLEYLKEHLSTHIRAFSVIVDWDENGRIYFDICDGSGITYKFNIDPETFEYECLN